MRGLFLRWEIDKLPLRRRDMIACEAAARACELDLTLDEFRDAYQFGPHPDPTRGAMKIWQEIPAMDADAKADDASLEAVRDNIRKNEAGLGDKGWKEKYPNLF